MEAVAVLVTVFVAVAVKVAVAVWVWPAMTVGVASPSTVSHKFTPAKTNNPAKTMSTGIPKINVLIKRR